MLENLWFTVCGLVSGVLGGMGMGGGTLLIPLLSIFYSVSQHLAQALNLISFIPMAVCAIFVHAKNGLIEKKGIWNVIIPAVIFGVLMSLVAKWVDGEILKRIFGGFLLVLSVFQFFGAQES